MARNAPPVVAVLADVLTGLLALHLLITSATLTSSDRTLFGWDGIDAAWMFGVAGLAGLLSIWVAPARLAWLLLLTGTTLGRAATLIAVGSPDIYSRDGELRAALAWSLLWLAGVLAFVAARASEAIRNGGLD